MTDDELGALVADLRTYATDHQSVECKASRGGTPQRLWQTLSAFANTRGGGVLILGVAEDASFETVGVDDVRRVTQDVASLCDSMEPPIRALIRPHKFEEKPVIVAEVPETTVTQKPCYYKGAGLANGAFIRVADGDRRLTPYEVHVMLSSRGQPREDCEAVEGTSTRDLHEELTQRFIKRLRELRPPYRNQDDAHLLRTMGVTAERDGATVLTLGGLLALGSEPQRWFPELGLTFVAYPGENIGELGPRGERFSDEARVGGPVPLMIEPIIKVLQRNMKRRSVVHGLGRENQWEYPLTAIREALVNALVHRDLSALARGTPVQVQLFGDRLTIVNPGGLHGPVSVEELGETGISSSRNAVLMRILEDTPVPGEDYLVCENRGSGIGAMLVALRDAGMSPPLFHDSVAIFRITFPNHTLFDQGTLSWLASIGGDSLTDSQRVGLALLRNGQELSNEVFRKFNALDSRQATRELKALVDRGLVESHSSGRWTTYHLSMGPGRFAQRVLPWGQGVAVTPEKGPEAVARLLERRGTLSRAELADLLGAPDSTVRYWLKKLIAAGRVRRTTEKARAPGVRYGLTPGEFVLVTHRGRAVAEGAGLLIGQPHDPRAYPASPVRVPEGTADEVLAEERDEG
ncbi:MAG TPA: ATP-binding protein [Longimicrobiales bacterium]|nr:ATP-binding protein [Longimicrobiales bacterium]